MKYSISPFIKILFVTLIILITFPTHLLAYTSNSNITESFHSFKQRFGEGKDDWIKIYRCSMPGAGERAAKWAEEHYKDTDKTYLVTLNLKSERFTYCTKIIYQAYKYGVSKNSINEHGLLIISPYALVDNFTKNYQLKLVKQY
ncbi:hypothetical protein HI031_09370 [Staphylococcus haemolyticus]|nr:hypothetical protein HI031_09370 [Staphylococcus haemolyticus]